MTPWLPVEDPVIGKEYIICDNHGFICRAKRERDGWCLYGGKLSRWFPLFDDSDLAGMISLDFLPEGVR